MTETKRAQSVLLEMGKAIADVLEKHNIPYSIAYGTLLGAVRHEGFVPWDDDFDFFLFDDSYDEAIELLRQELPASMFVEDEKSEPLYFHAWAHVKDLNSKAESVLFPQDNVYSHNGLNVDLYRIKKLKRCELNAWINDENEKYINRRRQKGLISDDEYKKRLNALKENRKQAQKSTDDHEVYGLRIGNKALNAEDIFPLKKLSFEDREFFAPSNYDKVLTELYGDYMTPPPESERHGHYTTIEFY